MVDRLVYTRVGAPTPLPAAIKVRRSPIGAVSPWMGVIAFIWLALAIPASAADPEMTFRLATLEDGKCGARCPQMIVAEGVIEEHTPEAFIEFAKAATVGAKLSGVILINSLGGRIVASMQLGEAFRKLNVAVVVASYEQVGGRSGPASGLCMSACVYAMMGGVKRIVPPESQVGIHRMSTKGYDESQSGQTSGATVFYADGAMVAALAHYAAQMGVNPALIRTAETISPDEILILSPSWMRRWHLATGRL
jgi:hypothetical protein